MPRVTTATMHDPIASVELMLLLKNIMMIFFDDSTQKMIATSAAKVSSVNLVKNLTKLLDDVTATNIRMIAVQMPVQA